METTDKPDKIPALVSQALHWLDQLKIPYRYCKDGDLWELTYENLYLLIPNDCEDREIGFQAPDFIDDEDEQIQKMVFDFAVTLVENEPDFENADIVYCDKGLGYIAKWYGMRNERYKPRQFKKRFVEMLEDIHDLQIKFIMATKLAYEAMFNPPAEVLREVLGETDKSEDNE